MAIKGQLPERKKTSELSKEEFTKMIKHSEEDEKNINRVIEERKNVASKKSKKRETKKPYTLTLLPSIHDAGAELAEEEGLSFSSWLEKLIKKEIK